jgi:hypothetical protein
MDKSLQMRQHMTLFRRDRLPSSTMYYAAEGIRLVGGGEWACASYHLGRKPQTLRVWACLENGPIRPIRVHGRLAWSVADINRILKGEGK